MRRSPTPEGQRRADVTTATWPLGDERSATPPRRPLLLLGQDGVLQLLGNACLDDGLCRDLDGFAGRRVSAHARLPFLHDELDHARKDELTRALELLLSKLGQGVKEFARL